MYKPLFGLACTEVELASYQTYQGFNNNFKKPAKASNNYFMKPFCVIGS
jgi:hypothetical protein